MSIRAGIFVYAGWFMLTGPLRAADLSGSWRGCWQDAGGHRGTLRAIFCKCDDCHYRVTFRGRFWVLFPFRYSVVLTVTGQEGNKVYLSGESYLGGIFGTFTYDAEATETEFTATYSSCRYQGIFVLKRCCP